MENANSKKRKFNIFSLTPLNLKERNQCAKTPVELYDQLNAIYKFNFDPCPTWPDDKPQWDGLEIDWKSSNYVNPPYKSIHKWAMKARDEQLKGNNSVLLIPLRADRIYFREWVIPFAEIIIVSPRLTFQGYSRPCPWMTCLAVYKGISKDQLDRDGGTNDASIIDLPNATDSIIRDDNQKDKGSKHSLLQMDDRNAENDPSIN